MANNYVDKKALIPFGIALIMAVPLSAQDVASTYSHVSQGSPFAITQKGRIALRDVLNELHKEFDVKLSYKNETIGDKGVDSDVFISLMKVAEFEVILERILTSQGLQFEKLEDVYIIFAEGEHKPREVRKKHSMDVKIWRPDPLLLQVNAVNHPNPINPALFRQVLSVSGRVTGEDGEPLPGVNIIVKGTVSGTVTDLDGTYTINVSNEDDILIFSYIGFVEQEVTVNGRSVIDIVLSEDVRRLDEIVVVGYGTMKKSDLTGSVVSAPIDDFRESPNVSILQSLQGTVPGLNVGQVDQAGESPSISIRGQNTISGSSSPLFVVDGVIFRGSLIDLNPSDIESIDILKDASSTAIFGSEAANGVILITTKSGAGYVGKPKITYSGSYSLQTPSHDLIPLDRNGFLEKFRDAFWEENRVAPDYLTPVADWNVYPYFKTSQSVEGYDNGTDMNWHDLMTRDGHIQNHNIGIVGGTDKINYFTSFGYTRQEGWLINDNYDRYNIRINIDNRISDWFKVGMQSFLTVSDYSDVSPPLSRIWWAPINAAYDANGEPVLEPTGLGINPLLDIKQDNLSKRLNLFGNVYAEIAAPFLKGLSYRIKYGNNYRHNRNYNFNPNANNFQGTGYKSHDLFYDWNFDNILTFKESFNGVHNLDVTLVYGRERRSSETTDATSSIFINDILGYNALEAGAASEQRTSSGGWVENSLYRMGRLVYNYNNKYLLTATYRRDGFSGFGQNKKFATFPSVALGWVASEENFIKDNFSTVDYLKLRISYGTNGNRTVNRYQTLSKVAYQYSYVYGDGGSPELGQWISSMSNNELGWETTTGLNFGFDFEILNQRVTGTVDYYNNNTHDLLYEIKIPTITGFSSIATNIGELHNHGLEIGLTTVNVRKEDFSWVSGINFSRNRNRVTSILGLDDDGDGEEDDIVSSNIFIGEPLGVLYDYKIEGMYQLDEEVPSGFYPGNYKISDLNGDGLYSPGDDRTILGYTNPGYRFSIQNKISYKNWSLNVFVNSIQGGGKYYYGNGSPQENWDDVAEKFASGNSIMWDYWMPENPGAKHERLGFKSSFSTILPVQRNFVRLQDVSLSYTFPKSMIERSFLEGAKVYLSGKNIFTWTKWEGWDPETGIGLIEGGRPVMSNYSLGMVIDL